MNGKVALLPVRSFRFGKRRLSGHLEPGALTRLGRSLARRVADATLEADMSPVVVTADREVALWADQSGIEVVTEPGAGLDGAARAGAEWANRAGVPWLVLHADLPLVSATDILLLAAAMEDGREVIAPSADGGTTAISSNRMLRFRYGPGSFHRHLRMLDDPVVVVRTGLLHDLDSPGDLTSAARHPAGEWI